MSISTLDSISVVASVLTSVGTVVIALLAQFFSKRHEKNARAEQARENIRSACSQIDVDTAQLLLRSRVISFPSSPSSSLGGGAGGGGGGGGAVMMAQPNEIEDACTSSKQYLQGNGALSRIILVSFLESLRAASFVMDTAVIHNNPDMSRTSTNLWERSPSSVQVWLGMYDPATTALRIGFGELQAFLTHKEIGGPVEKKQEFVKGVLGSEEEWLRFQRVALLFNHDLGNGSEAAEAIKTMPAWFRSGQQQQGTSNNIRNNNNNSDSNSVSISIRGSTAR